jgi:hypothetical protein
VEQTLTPSVERTPLVPYVSGAERCRSIITYGVPRMQSGCSPQNFGQVIAKLGRRLQPALEPAGQLGHGVCAREAEPVGQMPKRCLAAPPAEPGRYGSRKVGMAPRPSAGLPQTATTEL